MTVVLSLLLALAVGGTVCVVWADRGGPPWVRVVARVTLALGSAVRTARRKWRLDQGGDGGGDD